MRQKSSVQLYESEGSYDMNYFNLSPGMQRTSVGTEMVRNMQVKFTTLDKIVS